MQRIASLAPKSWDLYIVVPIFVMRIPGMRKDGGHHRAPALEGRCFTRHVRVLSGYVGFMSVNGRHGIDRLFDHVVLHF